MLNAWEVELPPACRGDAHQRLVGPFRGYAIRRSRVVREGVCNDCHGDREDKEGRVKRPLGAFRSFDPCREDNGVRITLPAILNERWSYAL